MQGAFDLNPEANPFEPPRADIEPLDITFGTDDVLEEPRTVPAGNGLDWISDGWALYKRNIGLWILMLITSGAIFIVVSLIPLLGMLGGWLIPMFMGGWMIASHRAHTEGEVRFEDLFAGFSQHFSPLAIAGLIYLGASVIVTIGAVILAAIFGGAAAFLIGGDGNAFFVVAIILGVLVGIAMLAPVMMLIWFAPALIVLNGVAPVQALKMSFFGCLRNILPFLLYGLVALLLLIVGAIPLGLGWLIVYPVLVCAVYAGYRDVFLEDGRE
ncbi:MAG: BPSS1780 family membrane protein [Wenzhouxiangella sp.]